MKSVQMPSFGVVVFHWFEIRVIHCISWRDSLSMVISKHFAQKVEGFFSNKLVVLRVNEFLPWFARLLSNNVIIMTV